MSAGDVAAVRRMLREAARPDAVAPAVPASREVLEHEIQRMLDPARFRTTPRRSDGRTQAEVNESARLGARRLAWESRGIPWDEKAARALVAGRRGLALRHFEAEGVWAGDAYR